jgi:hypothetical protein
MRSITDPAAWLLVIAAVLCPVPSHAQAKGQNTAPAPRSLDAAGSAQTFALYRMTPSSATMDTARWLTTARIHQDAQGLHVWVKANDAAPERIQAPAGPHDATLGGDSITLSVDAKATGQAAYEFRVNAAGATADSIAHGVDGSSKPWSGRWVGRATLTTFGWEVSFLVPWATLGLDARSTQPHRIAVNVLRHIGRGDMPVLSMAFGGDGRRCHACFHQPLVLMPGSNKESTSVAAAAWSNRANANVVSTTAPRSGTTTNTVAANTELKVNHVHAWRVAAEASRSNRSSISEGPRGNALRAQQTIAQDEWTHQLSVNAKRQSDGAVQPTSEIEATHRLARDVKREGADTWVSGYGAAVASQGRWKNGGQDSTRGVDLMGQLQLQRNHSVAMGYGAANIDGRPSALRARRTSISGKSKPSERWTIKASMRTASTPQSATSLTQRSHGLSSSTAYQINRHVTLGAQSLVERTAERAGDSSKATALQASTTMGFNANHQLRLAASTHQRHQSQTSASIGFPRSEKSTRGQWNYTYRPSQFATVAVGQRHASSLNGQSDAALRTTFERNNDKVWFTQVVVTY